MSYDESRRFPRAEFRLLPWTFALKLDAPFAGKGSLRVEARNIGAGGMKFVSNHRIPVFSAVEISLFETDSGKELLKVNGKVVRLEEVDMGQGEKTYGMALEFTDPEPLRQLFEKTPSISLKTE